MKKIIFAFLIGLTCCSLTACKSSPNNTMIRGKWQGTQWLVDGQPGQHDPSLAVFNFGDDGKYSFDYGQTKQAGTYKVENDMLFTTPENQNEIMVKIVRLTNDSLVFDMNRGGTPETLTLLRK